MTPTPKQTTPASRLTTADGKINDLLQAHMIKHGLTKLEEIADAASISRATIYNIALGHSAPNLTTLVSLARTLDMPTHVLLYRFQPDAPGAEQFSEQLSPHDARSQAKARLRALAPHLPSSEEFLQGRPDLHGELL